MNKYKPLKNATKHFKKVTQSEEGFEAMPYINLYFTTKRIWIQS